MRRGWRLGAALLAAALVGLSSPMAVAQPIGVPVPPAAGAQSLLELQITELSPRVVTSETSDITVTGKITNTGDQSVDQIGIRLQRGDAVDSDKALREIQNQTTDAVAPPFQKLDGNLRPGDSRDVSITIPVGNVKGGLKIDDPGVYPLLVNVNGRPEDGEPARLIAMSVPLPVMSVQGGPAATTKAQPPSVTILWPLLDEQPRRLPTTDGTTVLTDDELADSLNVGGRLFNLVNAVRAAETDSELLRSICFAVDPDLLATVSKMAEGYQVRTGGGQLVAGKGEQAAADWLTMVRSLTRGHCVLAVPYADADLAALSRAGAIELAQLSLAGSSIVSDVLEPVQPLTDVYWPAGGTFDQRTLINLANVGPATVLADPGHLENVEGRAPYVVNGTQTAHAVTALPVDSLVSDALAGTRTALDGDAGGSVQNGLAALVYRAAFDQREGGQVLVTPPRRWLASAPELNEFLQLTGQLLTGGFVAPQSLNEAVGAPEGGTASNLAFTAEDSGQEIPTQVTAEVMRINSTKQDMFDAMADDNTNSTDPNSLLAPLGDGLLRGMSTAWRGRTQSAMDAVDDVDQQLDALRSLVVVNDPGRPLQFASGDSPIPISIYNGLPVTIVVRVSLSSTPGLHPDTSAIQEVRIPPNSGASRYIPVEVSRSGRFSVDVRLATPGGTSFGEPVRLELNSTSYGIIGVAVTSTAGVVLVLLVVVRIFRRVKSARAGESKASEEIVDA